VSRGVLAQSGTGPVARRTIGYRGAGRRLFVRNVDNNGILFPREDGGTSLPAVVAAIFQFRGAMEPKHYFWLSTGAAVLTILLKTFAWWLTGSMGLLSDALESFVNLAGAIFALWMITVARQPPDAEHPLGHGKAEYFSSGFEGLLIFAAAAAIIYSAVGRLLAPHALESVSLGLVFSGVSTAINFGTAVALRRASGRFNSIALEADSKHLMTDVWTSVGVVVGVVLVGVSGWIWLDAVVAILVGVHILGEGWRLLRTSAHGLMDATVSEETLGTIEAILARFAARGVGYRNLRTRRAGADNFVYVDIVVPREWNIVQAHDVLDEVEEAVKAQVPRAYVVTHPEPADR
jgi:cation diffusion facilitator family transporter